MGDLDADVRSLGVDDLGEDVRNLGVDDLDKDDLGVMSVDVDGILVESDVRVSPT